MKSFVQYLAEADYSRFLKRNKRLSDEQRKEINRYFSKINTAAGSKINWQSRETREWTYADFENIMLRYKSGFRKKLKVKVPGKKGEDYWQVKLKTKGFLAYIPLNIETASFFNSAKFGACGDVNYCIGWKDDPGYWDEHMIDNEEVPVYVVDGYGKWVVIIEDGNRDYQVWDKMNKIDISKKDREPIPNFSIKKELMNSKMRKLYDEIREEFYTDEERHEEKEPDYTEARDDYDKFVADIERAQTNLENAKEEQENEMKKILVDTLERYEELRDNAEPLSDALEEEVSELEGIQKYNDAPYYYKKISYSEDEFKKLLYVKSAEYDDAYEIWNKYDDIYNELNEMDVYEMYQHSDDYEWTDEVPDEDGQYYYEQNIDIPELCYYDDYSEYIEDRGYDCNNSDLKQAIWSYIYEGGYNEYASDVLSKLGYFRP